MPHYPRIVGSLMLFLALSADSSADEPAKLDTAQLCFDRFQKITTLVMDHHIDPPTLQEMFLGGVKALYLHAGVKPPADLSRRVSGLSTGATRPCFLERELAEVRGPAQHRVNSAPDPIYSGLLHACLDTSISSRQRRPAYSTSLLPTATSVPVFNSIRRKGGSAANRHRLATWPIAKSGWKIG